MFRRQVGILVKLCLEALHLLEEVDELAACRVALEVRHLFRSALQPLSVHEFIELVNRSFKLVDDHRGCVNQPDLIGAFGFFAGKKGNGQVNRTFLLAKVEYGAVGLGAIQDAIGTGEGLNQPVVLEVFIHVDGVQELGVEAGEQHIHHDNNVNLLRMRQVLIGILLIFEALLHILIVKVEFVDAVVGAVTSIVVGNDRFESRLLFVRGFLVVGLLLRQVFLNLQDILVAFGGRGKDAGNVQGKEVALSGFSLCLHGFEKAVIGNGVVDGCRGQNGVELAPVGGGMMFLEDGFDNGFPGQCFARLELVFAFRLKIVDMEAQDIVVFNGVRNGVGVQLLLKNVFRGFPGGLLPFNLLISGIFRKDRRAGEAEELGVGKKLLDGFVVFAELGAVTFVKNENHALFAKWFQPFLVVAFAAAIEGEAELLDGGNDYFIGVVIGEQPLHQGFSIGVFFDAVLLKAVEFLSRLPVEIFAVHHEKTFVNIRIILEQGGGLEGGECFAAAGGVPDVTVAAVLVNALHDGLDSIDLVRPHHHQLLLAGHKHHVAADHFAQRAFGKELLGEAVEMGDLLVVFTGKLVERQITFVGIEGEVAVIVIGEVPGIGAVADDEELQEAEQCSGVTVAGSFL